MSCSRGCCASFKEHIQNVTFSATATPNRRADAVRVHETERQWEKDGDAYKRIRQQGLQPKSIDGCATLEKRADDVAELAAGRTLTKKEAKTWNSTQELVNASQ